MKKLLIVLCAVLMFLSCSQVYEQKKDVKSYYENDGITFVNKVILSTDVSSDFAGVWNVIDLKNIVGSQSYVEIEVREIGNVVKSKCYTSSSYSFRTFNSEENPQKINLSCDGYSIVIKLRTDEMCKIEWKLNYFEYGIDSLIFEVKLISFEK